MTPRRILITGADGFVGRHLQVALRRAYPDAVLHVAGFDVTDAEAGAAAVSAAQPDAVVHLAAVAAPMDARRDPGRAWSVNLQGTLTLARAVLEGAPGARFLFAGTADAYGASFRGGEPVGEGAPLAPQNVYGATKAAADLALGAMVGDGLQVIRARPFNHTGPGQTEAFVVPAFARQVARIEAGQQEAVLKVGALSPERDFLDVRDVCAAYAACLAAELPAGTILNIASGVPRRIGDILQDLMRLAGVEAEVETEQARLRPGDIPRAVGDARLAHALLGWAPHVPWEESLGDILEDWRGRVRG